MTNQSKFPSYFQSVVELCIAGVIWGGSFTLVKWALVDFSATTLIFWRFIFSFLVGEAIHYFVNRKLFHTSFSDSKLAMKAGIFLGLSLFLQTYGLNFTSATNSGFITSLYVILIPLISAIFFKTSIKAHHILLSVLAFVGTGFLLNLEKFEIQFGEILTLGAALTAAFQIIFVGDVAKHAKSAFRFNNYQTFWCLVTILPFLVFEVRMKHLPLWPVQPQMSSVISLLVLALLVTLLAFYLQIRAQRVLSTTTSSMLCLLEGPFSFVFAFFFLSESMSLVQGFGAFLILLSCALSILIDRPKNRNH